MQAGRILKTYSDVKAKTIRWLTWGTTTVKKPPRKNPFPPKLNISRRVSALDRRNPLQILEKRGVRPDKQKPVVAVVCSRVGRPRVLNPSVSFRRGGHREEVGRPAVLLPRNEPVGGLYWERVAQGNFPVRLEAGRRDARHVFGHESVGNCAVGRHRGFLVQEEHIPVVVSRFYCRWF